VASAAITTPINENTTTLRFLFLGLGMIIHLYDTTARQMFH
jgi:hypothetical protein